ncbi:MAG TPA: hypothetical protein ENJ52_08655 [Aliiroseovarius sp.]|nr:hypothetical protein [Aliiroseovarius sp.]
MTLPQRYRRFPGDHAPPGRLPGVEILRPGTDPGPAGKAVPAAQRLAGQDIDLLYCDDDWLPAPNWAAGFIAAARARPGTVICASGFDVHRLGLIPGPKQPRGDGPGAGFVDIAQGFGGVLIRPGWLADFTPTPDAWAVDDIALSAHFARRGRPIWKEPGLRTLTRPLADPHRLQDARIGGIDRATANRQVAARLARRHHIWSEP